MHGDSPSLSIRAHNLHAKYDGSMSDLSALNLEAGSLVGGYTLISRLGSGAMGSVWRVRDDGGHHQSADEKRQAEGCVKLHRQKSPSLRLMSITTPRVLIPRGQASRHLPHNMHLFISS